VPAEVHLPEAVLGVHVALGEEEVVVGLGDELRDARIVAVHHHGRVESGDVDPPARGGEGSLHRPPPEPGRCAADDEHCDEDDRQCREAAVPSGSRCIRTHVTPS
jgi:hypothetical protein